MSTVKEESFQDWWDRTYRENIEEKVRNGIPLSGLERAIYSADQDAKGATIAFVFAFIIAPLLIYFYIKLSS